jgi:hypothetical protein
MPGPDPVDPSRVNPLGTQAETANASMAHHQNRSPGRERQAQVTALAGLARK